MLRSAVIARERLVVSPAGAQAPGSVHARDPDPDPLTRSSAKKKRHCHGMT